MLRPKICRQHHYITLLCVLHILSGVNSISDISSWNFYGFTDSLDDYVPFRDELPRKRHVKFMRHKTNRIKCVLKTDYASEIDMLIRLNFGPTTSPFVEKLYFQFQAKQQPIFDKFDSRFLVLEYVDGYDLMYLSKTRIAARNIRHYLAQLVLAVEFIHSRGIFYNDLKPDNVVISKEERLVVIDFDVAKFRKPNDEPYCIFKEMNRNYCSPQKIFANGFHQSSHDEYLAMNPGGQIGYNHMEDFYGIGVLLYYMFCASFPYATTQVYGNTRAYLFKNILPTLKPCSRLESEGNSDALDLVNGLLHFDVTKRLGANGFAEIRNHKYFQVEFDTDFWDNVERKGRKAQTRDHAALVYSSEESKKSTGSLETGTKTSIRRRASSRRPNRDSRRRGSS